jgi:hypothetical protein
MLLATVAPKATRKPSENGSDCTVRATVEAMKRFDGPAKGMRFTKKDPTNTPINSMSDAIFKIPISLLSKK